ncbi:MAG: hypothetical protein PHZ11_01130 [Desulfitobacteriaceae bacterium]|nr:hypothetical protein [Clostridia bacterium]MDD4345496.1 hypothetical protein [Desulfitobacteriaceae bacterium]MDD4400641.1 hypothetical protein [Desulfitobacteriaceae bacterium]
METLFHKLKEYLHMDEEIPFEEFSRYYKDLISFLNSNFSEFNQDDCIKARFISTIVQGNADSRSKSSRNNGKAFKKMKIKCAFWADAINYRLLKEGINQQQIEEATQAVSDSI